MHFGHPSTAKKSQAALLAPWSFTSSYKEGRKADPELTSVEAEISASDTSIKEEKEKKEEKTALVPLTAPPLGDKTEFNQLQTLVDKLTQHLNKYHDVENYLTLNQRMRLAEREQLTKQQEMILTSCNSMKKQIEEQKDTLRDWIEQNIKNPKYREQIAYVNFEIFYNYADLGVSAYADMKHQIALMNSYFAKGDEYQKYAHNAFALLDKVRVSEWQMMDQLNQERASSRYPLVY